MRTIARNTASSFVLTVKIWKHTKNCSNIFEGSNYQYNSDIVSTEPNRHTVLYSFWHTEVILWKSRYVAVAQAYNVGQGANPPSEVQEQKPWSGKSGTLKAFWQSRAEFLLKYFVFLNIFIMFTCCICFVTFMLQREMWPYWPLHDWKAGGIQNR